MGDAEQGAVEAVETNDVSPESLAQLSANKLFDENELFALDLFQDIFTEDDESRRAALDAIEADLCSSDVKLDLLIRVIRTCVQLTYASPFDDVRDCFCRIVEFARRQGINVPPPILSPSRFVLMEETVPVNTPDPEIRKVVTGAIRVYQQHQQIFVESFFQNGRVPNVVRLLAWHPSYLKIFVQQMDFLMKGEGPLPHHWRYYIAIMASSRHRCRYLVSRQETFFREAGGPEAWLQGIQFAPRKLQELATLNGYLSHQPWMITKEHIEHLARGTDNWSMSELVQAIVIMTTYQSLASFIYGCGVVLDREEAYIEFNNLVEEQKLEEATQHLLVKLKESVNQEEPAEAESARSRIEAFENAGYEGDVCPTDQLVQAARDFDYDRFSGGIPLVYRDFDLKTFKVFRLQDYCWSDHGYALVRRFYPGAAGLLDEQFTVAETMTYHTLHDSRNVNTDSFRRAIWYYTQRVLGMINDDYDYRVVNKIMEVVTKAYIKKIACYPERIGPVDFHRMGLKLTASERCHVNIIALEAAKQAAMLYGLHAVWQFMAQS